MEKETLEVIYHLLKDSITDRQFKLAIKHICINTDKLYPGDNIAFLIINECYFKATGKELEEIHK